ncbi:tumor necrosis factor receptor superfamily member 1A [Anableps anableps]
MEGIGNQGRCTFTLLLLMLMSIPALMTKEKCKPWEFETENEICCDKCSPGFKLLEKCPDKNLRSNCTPCNEGEFSDQMNFSPTCRRCNKCKASRNEYEVSPCQKNKNTICQCNEGYYKYNIDSETYDCLKCRKCGTDEIEKQPCTHEKDTECACKPNYYRERGKCELCSHCTLECTRHCSTSVKATDAEPHHSQFINMIAGAVVVVFVLLVLGILITYVATKWFFKKKLQSQFSNPSVQSKESSKDFLVSITEPSEEISLKAAVETPLGEQELSKLPDCVPMIPDLIYAVLDLVPVHQMKQLVRSLGVTDTEIEQVEIDHRFCREAHYQMLRLWAQRGLRTVGGGHGETVHRSLLEELLHKLRQIHLSQVAEELETKYAIQ